MRDARPIRAGDPVRAIKVIIDVVESASPPHHLLLGNDAYDGAIATVTAQRKNFEALEAVSRSADFPVIAASFWRLVRSIAHE